MSQSKFIRLNTNDNYLSFGNLFRIIKEESSNSNTFVQSDLFSIIFDTYDVADSTVNNYCTGYRAINAKYKRYFEEIRDKYKIDKKVLVSTIAKVLELIEDRVLDVENISIIQINNNIKLKHICNKLYSISKNDSDVNIGLSSELYQDLESNKLYDFIVKILFYVILEKRQPIHIDKKLNEVIEKNIYDTNISINDIQEFIKIQLNSGIWSIRGIKELAKKENPFACFEMASMECYGIITGKSRYEEAYKYYKIAAEKNHPVANWAMGYLYYQGCIGNKTRRDLYLALKYFNKAKRLNCSNAFNSLGLILLNADIPHVIKNKEKAIKMFEKAISLGNVYAYNNLGKIYENENKYRKAFECYMVSANLGESWAENKVADYYMKGIAKEKNIQKAFDYYLLSSQSSRFTLCHWSKVNLAKYFYKDGNSEIGIKRDVNKAIELLDEVSDELIEASEELVYIYYNLFIESHKENENYLKRLNFYKEKCEKNMKYNTTIKNRIENTLKQINNFNKKIKIPK